MDSGLYPFLLPGDVAGALLEVCRRLERLGLSAEPLIDLPSACAPRLDRPCPHDGSLPCSCRLTALRIGSMVRTDFVLVAHRHGARTWLTIEPPEWVSSRATEAPGSQLGEPEGAPPGAGTLQEDAVELEKMLEQVRRSVVAAADALEEGDPCLEVIARLTEARRYLRSASRSAIRSHWERSRREILSTEAFDQREQAVSRLLDVVRPVALDPSLVR